MTITVKYNITVTDMSQIKMKEIKQASKQEDYIIYYLEVWKNKSNVVVLK